MKGKKDYSGKKTGLEGLWYLFILCRAQLHIIKTWFHVLHAFNNTKNVGSLFSRLQKFARPNVWDSNDLSKAVYVYPNCVDCTFCKMLNMTFIIHSFLMFLLCCVVTFFERCCINKCIIFL